MQKRLVEKKLR